MRYVVDAGLLRKKITRQGLTYSDFSRACGHSKSWMQYIFRLGSVNSEGRNVICLNLSGCNPQECFTPIREEERPRKGHPLFSRVRASDATVILRLKEYITTAMWNGKTTIEITDLIKQVKQIEKEVG